MTSKISFSSIAKEDLRRRSWMLALSCLGSALAFPILFLLGNGDYIQTYTNRGADRLQYLAYAYSSFFTRTAVLSEGIILYAGAVIVAVFGFRYLYSRKMVDTYHSLPVKRNRLFIVTYINGLLIWLIPMLLSMVAALLLVFFNMLRFGIANQFGNVILSALGTLPFFILSFLTVYHFCLICVMLSGNAFNAICTSAVGGTIVALLYGIVLGLCNTFFDTFVQLNLDILDVSWASPLVSPFFLLSDAFVAAIPENTLFYVLCVIMAILMFALAFRLYLKRPSELAEHGVDNPYFQSFFRMVAAFAAGMLGAAIFMSITSDDNWGWQVFAIVLCGGFTFGVADIILHMNLRSFFAHKMQMLVTVIATALFLFVFSFDLTGFDTRLPDQNKIASASIRLSSYRDSSWSMEFFEDGSASNSYEESDVMNYCDITTLYPFLETLATHEHQNDFEYITSVQIHLKLENGRNFARNYHVKEEDLDALRPVVNSDEYRTAWYPMSSGLCPLPSHMNIDSDLVYSQTQVTDADHISQIMDAYYADFLEHYSIDELLTEMQVGTLYLSYPYNNENSVNSYNASVHLTIYGNYHRTIALIKEYYPELTMDRMDLEITKLEINKMLANEDVILLPASYFNQETEKTASQQDQEKELTVEMADAKMIPQVTAEVYEYDPIEITDPEALARLKPILHFGNDGNTPFKALEKYYYLGDVSTVRGHSISCYIPAEKAPLDLTDFLP